MSIKSFLNLQENKKGIKLAETKEGTQSGFHEN